MTEIHEHLESIGHLFKVEHCFVVVFIRFLFQLDQLSRSQL